MSREFHRPVSRPSGVIENLAAGGDPAQLSSVAYDTAAALLHHVWSNQDEDTVDKVVAYADRAGASEFAELWASAPPVSLPGAMWRLYSLRAEVLDHQEEATYIFQRGLAVDDGISPVVAGVSAPPTPTELVALITQILRGAFTGDFALALNRAGAFSHVMYRGSHELTDDPDAGRARHYDEIADQFLDMSDALHQAAGRWRAGRL